MVRGNGPSTAGISRIRLASDVISAERYRPWDGGRTANTNTSRIISLLLPIGINRNPMPLFLSFRHLKRAGLDRSPRVGDQ
jgi:hypothetical protein